MKRFFARLAENETGGSTVEWLLITGTSFILFGTLSWIINLMVSTIFTRTAIVIVTPYG